MFKIRCSQIGKIKANGKGNELSVGAKSYIEEKVKEHMYGVKKEFSSKYTDKGNFVEDDNISFYAENSEFGMLFKNEKYFEDEFFTGTPDIITKDEIIDIKSSWDCFSFPLFDDKLPNSDYYAQLQGYMELTGKRKARLVYVLSNTPEHLDYNNDSHDYSNIDSKLRIKEYIIEYDENFINDIKKKVVKCQEYFDLLINKIKNNDKLND